MTPIEPASPPEEMFDVVDADDHVIQQLPRSEVHRRKLLHRAVHVFLFRSDGRLLIHKRSPAKEEFPSVWTSSASGHVSAGEDYDSCVPRELKEELGLRAQLMRLQKFAACEATSWEFTVLYSACSDDEIHFDPVEMTEVRWMELTEIDKWIEDNPGDFSPAFRLLFQWFQSQPKVQDS
ncbi:MAG: NUDIX domain-containing protein [Planctomycetaceae bacterium]